MRKKTKTRFSTLISKYQFTTKLNVNNSSIDLVSETILLGTLITVRLAWDRNTEELENKGYKKMQLLNAAAGFTSDTNDLEYIYLTLISMMPLLLS